MKVGDLKPGMLIIPKDGMVWFKRGTTRPVLCVDQDDARFWMHAQRPEPAGNNPVMYMYEMPYKERVKLANVSEWGARIVMHEGALIAVDATAWKKIEPLSKLEDSED